MTGWNTHWMNKEVIISFNVPFDMVTWEILTTMLWELHLSISIKNTRIPLVRQIDQNYDTGEVNENKLKKIISLV